MYSPVVLTILDGWGLSSSPDNPLNQISLPTFDKLNTYYPLIALQASGISVGLPWGEPGNSEVGHMTMGMGKIIYQSFPRISLSIQNGSFEQNSALVNAMKKTKENGTSLHVMGLVGDGGVHSAREHLYALIEMAHKQNIKNLYIHCFMDGRDSSPTSGTRVIKEINEKIHQIGVGQIATMIGRNWAMDRNNNWDRIEKAYKMLVDGVGEKCTDPVAAVQKSYDNEITDEFIEPIVVTDKEGNPLTTIKDGDSAIFFNFREDRARQLTMAFVLPGFEKFERNKKLDIDFVTMVEYEKDLPVNIAFPPEELKNGLGETVSNRQKKQLRIAETEKYAHVTYFFNGGDEEPLPNEDRVLIPSPAVDTFDQKPEMSSFELTDKLIENINEEKYDLIVVNYAAPDMVAHTGNIPAAKEAAIATDKCIEKLIKAVLTKGGCLFITADHGNIEIMRNAQTGEVDTKHNTSPIPFWFVTPDNHRERTKEEIIRNQTEIRGLMSDIAPTVLDIMEIRKPEEMQGESLLSSLQ
ncbi:MAG: phosphoglycerate mutase (2,3-diphosphoglycerate-independent) [Candidatus Moraniibacteriota bacterium]|nr:MAG: phosphoglycerate mutase (2,3-diphosphoglycerate-independent) [Candidatus Moranbacteria bacterium]